MEESERNSGACLMTEVLLELGERRHSNRKNQNECLGLQSSLITQDGVSAFDYRLF